MDEWMDELMNATAGYFLLAVRNVLKHTTSNFK